MRITIHSRRFPRSGIGHFFDIANWAMRLKDKLLKPIKTIVIFDVQSLIMLKLENMPNKATRRLLGYGGRHWK